MTATQFFNSYVLNYKLLLVTAFFAAANLLINFTSTKDDVYEQLIQVETSGLIANDFFSQIKKLDYGYTFKNNELKQMNLKVMQLTPLIFNFVVSSNLKEDVENQTIHLKKQLTEVGAKIAKKYFQDCRDSINFLISEIKNSSKFENRELALDQINIRTKSCIDIFNEAERIVSKPRHADKETNHVVFLLKALNTDLDFLSSTLEKKVHFQITHSEAVALKSNVSIKKLIVAIILFHLSLCAFVALLGPSLRSKK